MINLESEKKYLMDLQSQLLKKINQLNTKINEHSTGFYKSMRYLWENRSEMDRMEIFSNQQSINQIVSSGEITVDSLNRIKHLADSPYFGRIDFCEDDEEDVNKIYIGRYTFKDDNHVFWVYDWRSPIAGMYYEYEIGSAFYDSPNGRIYGEITKKRQYKIKKGVLEYALESSMNINDEILQRELSVTSEKKMKNIISTIQKEQNRIIRNEHIGTSVIQGVAGSGKTSIALHRVAFLLYKYKGAIKAENIVILSPNKVFANYISDVLPELGEQPIVQLGIEEIAKEILTEDTPFREGIENKNEIIRDIDLIKRDEFKSTMKFLKLLDTYLAYADVAYFEAKDYCYGKYSIDKEFIQKNFINRKNKSVKERLQELSEEISARIKEMDVIEHMGPSPKTVFKRIQLMYKFSNPTQLYEDFYSYIHHPEMVKMHSLENTDIFPFIYIKIYFEGIECDNTTQHLVIDEMQDYTPIQYAVINKIYPCHKTILGDLGQNINPFSTITIDDFRLLYPGMQYFELLKSYRSSYEIIQFAKTLNKWQKIEPIPRHGEKVKILECDNKEKQNFHIMYEIEKFHNSTLASLGIICKDQIQAEEFYKTVSSKYAANWLNSDSTQYSEGITISTIMMAKGLEFDQVIVPDVDNVNYCSEYDRNLLYISCTRAMHALIITFTGSLSELINIEEIED